MLENIKVTSPTGNTAVAPEKRPTPAGQAEVKGKKKSGDQGITTLGQAEIGALSEEKRNELYSKSHTLHFVNLLGLASKITPRRTGTDANGKAINVDCETPVGLTLRSDEPIKVPVIDIRKDSTTGISKEDITYRDVQANEEFFVSMYEYMYLIIRPEYSGECANDDNPRGVYFSAKTTAFSANKAKLPTPTANFRGSSIKANIVAIDEQKEDGTWVIREPWTEKFSPLLVRATPKRSGGSKGKSIPRSAVVSAALRKIFADM